MNSIERKLAKWVGLGLAAAAFALPVACQAQQFQGGSTVQVYGQRQISSGPAGPSMGWGAGPSANPGTTYYRPTYTTPAPPSNNSSASWGGFGLAWPWTLPSGPTNWTNRAYSPPANYNSGYRSGYGGDYGDGSWRQSGQIVQNETYSPPMQDIPDAQPYVPRQQYIPNNPPPVAPAGSAVVYPQRVIYTPNPGERHHFHGGGYNYPYYGDDDNGTGYPSAYSSYPDIPSTVYAPGGLISYSPPVEFGYVGNYIPFSAPDFNNADIGSLYQYYDLAQASPFNYQGPAGPVYPPWETPPATSEPSQAPSEEPQPAPEPGTEPQPPAASSYPTGSYKEAFADIQSAWSNGDIDPIKKHLKSDSAKIAVSLSGKYTYSIASGDWSDITRDAFDHLQTVSFQFTELRFQKNGDITGYATHIYKGKSGQDETMYVSYTLRHRDGEWYIIGVNTAPKPIIPAQAKSSDSDDSSSSSSSDSDSDSSSSDKDDSSSGDINISN